MDHFRTVSDTYSVICVSDQRFLVSQCCLSDSSSACLRTDKAQSGSAQDAPVWFRAQEFLISTAIPFCWAIYHDAFGTLVSSERQLCIVKRRLRRRCRTEFILV